MAANERDGLVRSTGQDPGPERTVLLVEDEEAVRRLTRRILVRRGYVVLEAALPSEALALARQHGDEIDLLLTDVVMPEMRGDRLAQHIRKLLPGVAVLFMSAFTSEVASPSGDDTEPINFLAKPFRAEELSREVKRAIATTTASTK